ncbi:MAG: HD domain-containing protein [Spirochaetaceae bacterium]|jgi:HD superfamily phosphohydrolase|nr:HD domain-containing protein [Spirochaetaceae bacterium]
MSRSINAALHSGFTEPARDTLWGHIYLTPELKSITRANAFIRLHRIAQLGPANFCYPGATHSRAAHSLGVYHLTRRMLSILCERGAAEWLSFRGARSMLCAALLHDAGHFPYAHSLKELPLASHEELSGVLIRSSPINQMIADAGGDPEISAAIVDSKIDAKGDTEILFYRKLLSGCLDPDKLDYLNRDARYCGVPYGAQDIDFIFSTFHPHIERGVDITSRGIPSVEALLFSKYMMYRSVYWHHSVRCATAMVKKSLLAGLTEGVLQPEDLYNLTDAGLLTLMARMLERGHKLFALGVRAYEGQFFSLAAEFPFDGAARRGLSDIMERPRYEKKLAAALSSGTGAALSEDQIIIDVPEPFRFETGLFVRGENCLFDESTSFFAGKTAQAFGKSLRVVRVFIDDAVYREREALFSAAARTIFDSVAGE